MFKKIIKVFLLLVVVMVSGNINTSYGMNYIDYVIESSDEITGDGRHDDLVEPTANAVRDYIAEVGLENFNFNDVIIKVTQYILSSDTRRTREIMNHGGINNYTYIWLGSEIKNNSSFTTYSNGIVSGLSIGCNNGIFTAFNIYVCENGASNYPDCDDNVCENGATNYPSCTETTPCKPGDPWYPTCEPDEIRTEIRRINFGERTSDYTENWGNCALQGVWRTTNSTRNNDTVITCQQENISEPVITTGCGEIKRVIVTNVTTGEVTTTDTVIHNCAENAIDTTDKTNDIEIFIIADTTDTINVSTCADGIPANGTTQCSITYNFQIDSLDPDIIITGLEGKEVSNVVDLSNNLADQTDGADPSGDKALSFGTGTITVVSPDQRTFSFTIPVSSVSPLKSDGNKIGFDIEGVGRITTTTEVGNISYDFTKPFTGKLETSGDAGLTWKSEPEVDSIKRYKVSAMEESGASMSLADLEGYKLSLTEGNVKIGSEVDGKLKLETIIIDNSTETEKTGTIFDTTITTDGSGHTDQNAAIDIDKSILEYSLTGKTVKYYLSASAQANATIITTVGGFSEKIAIVGTTQLAGKPTITGQNENNSDLQGLRDKIIRAAKYHIASMSNEDIIGGVKYVEGDYIISSSDAASYETVVVKGGNVIIENNLIKSGGKSLGIVVLSDNYNPETNAAKGNVYVTPNVTRIENVAIYADGGLISVKSDHSLYSGNTLERSTDLKNQLVLTGHLFTRNTVGGAQGGSTNGQNDYVLPGGNIVTDFSKAMEYDLEFIRSGNIGWDGDDTNEDGNDYNRGKDARFVVIMTSNEASSIPVLFKD